MFGFNRTARRAVLYVFPLTLAVAEAACQGEPNRTVRATSNAEVSQPLVLPTPPASAPVKASAKEQSEFMMRSARSAWAFVDRSYQAASGFPQATEQYDFVTIWDVGSALASYHSAYQLGLIPEAKYRRYTERALKTLRTMPLYENKAPNKLFAAKTGTMVDRKEQSSATGFGWSVIDVGRLLVWLKIIAENDPQLAPLAREVAGRFKLNEMVRDGQLLGEDLDPETGKPRDYQEGRLGYEQYAAEGFAQWGVRAERALDFAANGKPVMVNGFTVLADKRGDDMLTSEAFVMMGMELGLPGAHWRPLTLSILAAQEARWKKTGTVTMLSEDAVPVPPAYFYYYLLYRDGKEFVVASPLGQPNETNPRWVSAKAAFGYHALAPSAYTWTALQAVKHGSTPNRGWTAGVFEGTRNATKSFNLNTSAVVLEAALYHKRGCPLVQRTCAVKPAN
jgi:hypothetical protein